MTEQKLGILTILTIILCRIIFCFKLSKFQKTISYNFLSNFVWMLVSMWEELK